MIDISRFMEIDTCPICGREMRVRDNPFVGEPSIEKIPEETVFEIACEDDTSLGFSGCGYFQIARRDQTSLENDWVATYIINQSSPWVSNHR